MYFKTKNQTLKRKSIKNNSLINSGLSIFINKLFFLE